MQDLLFVSESIGKIKWMDQLGHATLYVLEITAMSIKKMSAAKPENVLPSSRCLKITETVSFNIASEASGQKLIKNAGNGPFWRVFENLKLAVKQCYQTGQF